MTRSRTDKGLGREFLMAVVMAGCIAVSGTAHANDDLDATVRKLVADLGLDGIPEAYHEQEIPDPGDPLPSLGRALFFSKQLSGDKDVACVTCHHPLLAAVDGLSQPVGIAAYEPDLLGPGRLLDTSRDGDPKAKTVGGPNTPRNVLTIFNVGLFQTSLMHDRRISILAYDEEGNPLYRTPESSLRRSPDMQSKGDLLSVQARFPVTSFEEMRGFGEFYSMTNAEVRDAIAKRLREDGNWLRPFQIGMKMPGASAEEVITFDSIAAAISAYERSQTFIDTPWRAYVEGDADAITEDQKEGARLFFASEEEGGYDCASCHSGDFFTDEKSHVVGMPQFGRGKRADGEDPGEFLVTQRDEDRYKFRTPPLLNVAETGPWSHTGAFESLEETVRYHADPIQGFRDYDFSLSHLSQFDYTKPFDNGKELTARTLENVSPMLPGKLPSDQEVGQLVAFLESLTDPCVTERECLQPWIASQEDDFDGQILQAVFNESGEPSAYVINETPVEELQASVEPSGRAVIRAAAVDPLAVSDAISCNHHAPEPRGEGERMFVDRTLALGIDHEHLVPGYMWYGRKYSFTLDIAMETGPVAGGDINGDCWSDLIFATHDGDSPQVIAYLNQQGKGFRKEVLDLEGLPDAVGAVALVDLNADYELDLAVGNLFGARESVIFHSSPNERFALRQRINMSKLVVGFAFADYTGDGWIDAFASHWDVAARPAHAPALMRNRGGNLHPADAQSGTTGAQLEQNFHFSPAFADFDGDGDQDLVIASDFGTSEVLENDGNNRFNVVTDHDVITDENGMGTAVADFDNDGILDWFVTSIYKDFATEKVKVRDFAWGFTGNRMYRGTGEGLSFVDVTDEAGVRNGAWGWGACAADFDNDGWLDIFHENGFGKIPESALEHIPRYIHDYFPPGLDQFQTVRPRLFMNQGGGTFKEEGLAWGFSEETNGRGVVCTDFDRDGDIDLVATQNSDGPRIYENKLGGENEFVGFHLVGAQPNTSAIGAVVTIHVGDQRQVRHVQLNSNYQSHNPTTLHFGLGSAGKVDRVTVRWPDGRTENLGSITAGRYYPLVHPELRDRKFQVANHPN